MLEKAAITWYTEIDVVRYLLTSAEFNRKFARLLKPQLFRPQLRPAVEALLRFWRQYMKLMPVEALMQEVRLVVTVGWSDDKEKALLKTFEEITAQPVSPEEFIADKVHEFIAFQAIENEAVETLEDLDDAEKTHDFSKLLEIGDRLKKVQTVLKKSHQEPIIRLDRVQSEPVKWLWHPYLPLGKLTIIEGDPGCGKSFLTTAICAHLTNGILLPTESKERDPMNVMFINREDGVEDTVKPRFESLDGDCTRFFYVRDTSFNLTHTDDLDNWIEETASKLVIVDPLQSFLGDKVDMYRANEVRPILDGLGEVAKKRSVSIVLIRHLTKSNMSKAGYRGMGSIDFTAAARSVLLAGVNPNDPEERAFVQTKSSLAREGASIGYKFVPDEWGGADKFVFTGESDLTAADLCAPAEDPSLLELACEFLNEQLGSGPKDSKEVKKAARMQDISEPTLKRARKKLKVKAEQVDATSNKWTWRLP